MNCTDWRNPPFFWAVMAFAVTALEYAKSEEGFFAVFLNALKVTAQFSTAPIYESIDLIHQLLSAIHETKLPIEFQTERFASLEKPK